VTNVVKKAILLCFLSQYILLFTLTEIQAVDKRELKKLYKQSPKPMGILQVKNLSSGKIFIASSQNLPGKLNSIMFQLDNGSHVNSEMQKDFNEVGKENFSFEIIDYLEPKEDPLYDYTEDLKILEQMWIEKLQPFNERGYNRHKKNHFN